MSNLLSSGYSVAEEEGYTDADGNWCWFENRRQAHYKCAYPSRGEVYIANDMYNLVAEDPLRYFQKKIEETFDDSVDIEITCRRNGSIMKWKAR